jgi:hypothetical protein
MAVEDADDLDPLLDVPIDHQMRTAGMDPHRWRKLDSFAGDLRELDQKIKEREKTVGITLCLIDTPFGRPMLPDVRKVVSRSRPDNPTAISRHAVRASGL